MDETILKLIQSLGVPGLLAFLAYRLLDKYLGEFLKVGKQQADAIGHAAEAMKESRDEQKQILMAVRVIASKQDELMDMVHK